MARENKQRQTEPTAAEIGNENEVTKISSPDYSSLASQGWFSLAFWLAFGLLLEGLIGFRSPNYLRDATRRELFRLAHAHGTIFSLLLLIVAVYLQKQLIAPPKIGVLAVQIGVVMMPVGFLLGGVWHYESDPNALVFLAPLGGLLIIFGVITIAFSSLKK